MVNHESLQKFKKITIVCNILLFGLQPNKQYVQENYEEMPRVCAQKKDVLFPKE
jgi:hypothetical protein